MNEDLILEILADWNYWGDFKKEFIERRFYKEKLNNFLGTNKVIIVKGIRRSGKSSIIYEFIKSKFSLNESLIINFEDPRFPSYIESNLLNRIYEVYLKNINPQHPKVVVLDEVQNVENWERFARFLIEAKGVSTIVTGSSSKLLSEEYATVLTGRHLDIEVFPLDFEEYLIFKGLKISDKLELIKKRFVIQKLLKEYIEFGGFPEIVLEKNENKKIETLKNYFTDILTKDIVKRYRIKKFIELENLAKNYISNISTIQSFNKLSKILDISLDSVERFSKYMENVRLFLFLNNFRYSVREQIRSKKKVYTIDSGFFKVFGFKISENIGRLMENLVAVELVRQKEKNPMLDIYYLRIDDREVDFVIKEGLEIKQLIQVTYASNKDEINNREIKALIKASELLKCKDLLIITWDYEDEIVVNNKKIKCVPLWKWLLKKEI